MSKKISIHINGTPFNIGVDDEFWEFLSNEIKNDLNIDGNNDAQMLLKAYVRKSQQLFEQNRKIQKILKKAQQV